MNGQPIALVTGGAHRLGKTFALTLAQRGYAILLHYNRSKIEANRTAEEIRAHGVPAYLVQADLTDDSNLFSLLSTLDSIPHTLKILVNSAGIMQKAEIRSASLDEWDTTLDLNLRAPFMLAKQASKRMTDGGLIVNITDAGAQKLWSGFPAYVVSKSALQTLTSLLAKVYAPDIRVNAIAPGLALHSKDISLEEWDKLIQRLPLRHPVALNELAAALAFLLDNPSITGQTIVLDSGYSLI